MFFLSHPIWRELTGPRVSDLAKEHPHKCYWFVSLDSNRRKLHCAGPGTMIFSTKEPLWGSTTTLAQHSLKRELRSTAWSKLCTRKMSGFTCRTWPSYTWHWNKVSTFDSTDEAQKFSTGGSVRSSTSMLCFGPTAGEVHIYFLRLSCQQAALGLKVLPLADVSVGQTCIVLGQSTLVTFFFSPSVVFFFLTQVLSFCFTNSTHLLCPPSIHPFSIPA